MLFEEQPDPHDCRREFCVDSMGMSRIAMDRLIALWPIATDQPAFVDGETVTVVGVVSRSGHHLDDPDISERVLIAYEGTWAEKEEIAWLGGGRVRGYLSLDPHGAFTPISWLCGTGHTEALLAEALTILDELPPLAPLCLDFIDSLGAPGDIVRLIIAATRTIGGLRDAASLHFITGVQDEAIYALTCGLTDSPRGARPWPDHLLPDAESCAIIDIGCSLSMDDAKRLRRSQPSEAWQVLASCAEQARTGTGVTAS